MFGREHSSGLCPVIIHCLSTLVAFSPLVLGLGPLSGCAEGSSLLNSDGTKATVPQASGQHGHSLDPTL